jgi:AcrR family transcriptional regulator
LRAVTTREQILGAGRRLFGDRAYDAISIDDIAAAAGVSKGLLYHYFDGKRGLYVETLKVEGAQLLAETEPHPDELDAGLDAYLDYVETHREGWLALMRGGVGSDAEVNAIVDGARQAIVDRLVATVGQGAVLRTALRGWVGMVEAAATEWVLRGDIEREQLRALLADALHGAVASAAALEAVSGAA